MAIPRKRPSPPGYFKGLYSLIADAVGCTPEYASGVLRGRFDDRDTELVQEIKDSYHTYIKAVNQIKQQPEWE